MKIKTYLFAICGIALFALSACSPAKTEPPEQVMQKFKETIKTVNAVDMSLAAVMKGAEAEDNIDFNVNLDIKLDRLDEETQKGDIDLKMNGVLNAGDQSLDGNLNLKVRTIGKELYFSLMELDTSDPKFQSIKPMFEPYKKKWMHLASDFIPEDIQDIQQKDEEALEKERQLKDLFISTKLFEVNKEYGVETLGGRKVYHYGIKLNKDGVKQYVKRAASINGREMTEAEVEEAAAFADSITSIEMWIGTNDYYLYKGTVSLSGKDLEQGVNAEITLTYTANSYNTDLKIEAPADFEEFNPISLMMGMQMPGMMPEMDELTPEFDTGDMLELE